MAAVMLTDADMDRIVNDAGLALTVYPEHTEHYEQAQDVIRLVIEVRRLRRELDARPPRYRSHPSDPGFTL